MDMQLQEGNFTTIWRCQIEFCSKIVFWELLSFLIGPRAKVRRWIQDDKHLVEDPWLWHFLCFPGKEYIKIAIKILEVLQHWRQRGWRSSGTYDHTLLLLNRNGVSFFIVSTTLLDSMTAWIASQHLRMLIWGGRPPLQPLCLLEHPREVTASVPVSHVQFPWLSTTGSEGRPSFMRMCPWENIMSLETCLEKELSLKSFWLGQKVTQVA